jgi:hypothetical protein
MPQILNYIQSGAVTVLMSGELDALANNGTAASLIDFNNASGYPLAQIEFRGAPQSYAANTGIPIWFLQAIVSGSYEDGSLTTSGMANRLPDVVIPLNSGSQRVTRRCQIPPQCFRTLIKNDGTGVSLGASGNILRIYPLSYQISSGA